MCGVDNLAFLWDLASLGTIVDVPCECCGRPLYIVEKVAQAAREKKVQITLRCSHCQKSAEGKGEAQ